jgi:hypothetical protein
MMFQFLLIYSALKNCKYESHQCQNCGIKSFEPLGRDPFELNCIFLLKIKDSKTFELSFLKDNKEFYHFKKECK